MPSIPFTDCPAKTLSGKDGKPKLGRNVFNHCQIVGHIARRLLDQLPHSLRVRVFPEGSEWVAAVHDVGKVSPTFFLKLNKKANPNWKREYPFLKDFDSPNLDESKWGGHAGVSMLALECEDYSKEIQAIAGQHHGFTPNTGVRKATWEAFGGEAWQSERKKLLDALQNEFGTARPEKLSEAQTRALSGLTSVADWIGSGSLFDDPQSDWRPNIDTALKQAGYVSFTLKPDLTFSDIFGFKPRAAQGKLIEACDRPGVYVLEAPMGLGKTEAALYAAYRILDKGLATGIYFALPTQLTSNKIYERFNVFLKTILAENCPHRDDALLLHSNAWLEKLEKTKMGEEGQPGKSWFNASKRGLLAPFAVGTLDQALMAVMNVRHGSVRAFGLVGKVVVLDEVHSYDAYTCRILYELISKLREMQCTVVILSATLSKARRGELLKAEVSRTDYPLITAIASSDSKNVKELPVAPPPQRHVNVQLIAQDSQALEESLKRAEQGQQVLWIENSVKDAQKRYCDFAARCRELGIACGLLHARFTPADRKDKEAVWVDALGKPGWYKRGAQGRIVVGTQVLEQSLDIDGDFLVSRFAPTDMLLQRLGRLWRHTDTPRSQRAVCEAWFIAPHYESALDPTKSSFGASAKVYCEYILCRSLEAWKQRIDQSSTIALPADIRPLIDATYAERSEESTLAVMKDEMERKVKELCQRARWALSKAGQTLPDTDAQTRYSEEETKEILLVSAIEADSACGETRLELLAGSTLTIPWRPNELPRSEWRKLSVKVMQQMVPCRKSLLPKCLPYNRCKELGLGNILYLGHPKYCETVPFAIAKVEKGGALTGFEHELSDRYQYHYRRDIGLTVCRVDEDWF